VTNLREPEHVTKRRKAKRELRELARRLCSEQMAAWLRRASDGSLPSEDNPYGGLTRRALRREVRRAERAIGSSLLHLPGFLRAAMQRGFTDGVKAFRGRRRRGRQRRVMSAFGDDARAIGLIDAEVAQGTGPKKAAEVAALQWRGPDRLSADALYKRWQRRRTLPT
jgi:hypothetical protein